MIPLNPRLKLVLGLVVIAAIGALQALGKAEPTWTWVGLVVQLLTASELYLTVPGNTATVAAMRAAAATVAAMRAAAAKAGSVVSAVPLAFVCLVYSAGLLFADASTGCSSTTANQVVQDITPVGACVAQELLTVGVSDPEQILAVCAGAAITDVIQVIETLEAAQPDSGTSPTTLQLRLAAIHTRALGMKVAR
jgi:hypothetical protein